MFDGLAPGPESKMEEVIVVVGWRGGHADGRWDGSDESRVVQAEGRECCPAPCEPLASRCNFAAVPSDHLSYVEVAFKPLSGGGRL